jgi:hypothetical protein
VLFCFEKTTTIATTKHIRSNMEATINNQLEEPEPIVQVLSDMEIVGLLKGNNHRNCCLHDVCGQHVAKGDLLRLVLRVVETTDNGTENAISLVKMENDMHTCTVAFLPRAYLQMPYFIDRIGSVVVVDELYGDSSNQIKRRLSHTNHGMAACHFVEVHVDNMVDDNDYE